MYSKCTQEYRVPDEELYYLGITGNQEAADLLKERYAVFAKRFAASYVSRYPWTGMTFGDVRSCAELAFLRCLRSFDPELGYFFPYWKKCAEMEVLNYGSSMPWLNGEEKDFLSLDGTDEAGVLLANKIGEPDRGMERSALLDGIEDSIRRNIALFSEEEIPVLLALMNQEEPMEIMEETGYSRSKTYRLVNSVKEKMHKLSLN